MSWRKLPCLMLGVVVIATWLVFCTRAHADVAVVTKQAFPRTAMARIVKRLTLHRIAPRRKLVYRLVSDGDYLRYFRIYVNGKLVFTRLVRTSVRGELDLSAHLPRAGSYTIMYETNTFHQSWQLESQLLGADGVVTSWSKWRERAGKPTAPSKSL